MHSASACKQRSGPSARAEVLEPIRGHQRSSSEVVIRGPQRSSEVLRGPQRSSEVLRGPQRSSEVIRGRHQYSSRCSSFSPLEQRSSMPTRRYTHLMREAISMHALSMHSARTQHALITHSARTHHALITHSSRTQHALSMHSYAPDDPLECLHVQIVHEGLITYFQPVEDIVRKAAQLRVAPFGQPLSQHLREIERGPVKGARISRNQWLSEAMSAPPRPSGPSTRSRRTSPRPGPPGASCR